VARSGLVQYRAQGDAVLSRLTVYTVPRSMKDVADAFRSVHAGYLKASDDVDAARGVRDETLADLADRDAALDELLEGLAIQSLGAGFGTRQQPLAKFTRFSVSRLRALAYKNEADEVIALTDKIAKAAAPGELRAAAAACAKQAKSVLAGVAALNKPQYAYATALAKRDTMLQEWTRAYARLKRSASVAWFSEPETYASVFAPPNRIAAPPTRRAKKKPPTE